MQDMQHLECCQPKALCKSGKIKMNYKRRVSDKGDVTGAFKVLKDQVHSSEETTETMMLIYDAIVELRTMQEKNAALQEQNAESLGKVAEIVTAWNNAKGFVKTIQMIVVVLKWLTLAFGVFVALSYAVTGRPHP